MKKSIFPIIGIVSFMLIFTFAQLGCSNPTSHGGGGGGVPSAPTGIWAQATSSDRIDIFWNPVSGAERYNVYRSYSSDGDYTYTGYIDAAYTGTWDDTLSPETVYYFKVSAENSNGESAKSTYAYDTTAQSGSLPSPGNIRVSEKTSQRVTLLWDAVPGATFYRLFRSTSPHGTYEHLGNAADPPGAIDFDSISPSTTYYYKVSSYNGSEGAQSIYVLATTLSRGTLPTPTGLYISAKTTTTITLSWNAVAGADSYDVYYSTSSSGPFQWAGEGWSAGTKIGQNTPLISGTTYYFKVTAWNSTSESYDAVYSGTTD